MKSNDVLTLLKAGYTKEEIQAMDQEQAPVRPEDVSDPDDDPVENNAPEDVKNNKEMTPEDMYSQMLQKMQDMLNDGLANIQKANIAAAEMPDVHEQTPEDIIAKIIAPEVKKK